MQPSTEAAFTLHCRDDGDVPALIGVDARGRLDGVLHTLTLRQTYRNPGPDALEVIYTFALPTDAVLLGLAAEFEGRRLEGRVLPAAQAESTYEQSLADGDATVLLEASPGGLYTANLGNLAPGETVTLEVRFGQLLAFEQGRLRLAIPTTVAPRYGDPERAGLQPQQVPRAALDVVYPLSVSVTVAGSLARGTIHCPTHPHRVERTGGAARLTLAPGATLDRDVVVVVTPTEPRPDLLMIADDAASAAAPTVALAAFIVPPRQARGPVALRLLVDCSGSMGGDGIASARRALRAVAECLGETDEASLTRFGSTVRHVVGAGPCGSRHLDRLRAAIDDTEANLGGTEMHRALQAVFSAWPRRDTGADVLLITDGEIWGAETLVESARRSGHRVFAIGVGSAPAEGVLRDLTDATGGAVEFATPGESLERAAERMLGRIRQVPSAPLVVDWGAVPVWQLPSQPQTFGGDTAFAFAGFASKEAPSRAVRLMEALPNSASSEIARTAVIARNAESDLARIAAARRMVHASREEAQGLALDYQLVSRHTKFVLVHERADEDRPTRAARQQCVPDMLAAGWGGTATLMSSLEAPSEALPFGSTTVLRSVRNERLRRYLDSLGDDIESYGPAYQSLGDLVRRVIEFIAGGGAVADLVVEAQDWNPPPDVRAALDETDALGIGRAEVCLLLAIWAATQGKGAKGGFVETLLARHVAEVAEEDRRAAFAVFARVFGQVSPTHRSWRRAAAMAIRRRP